MIKVLFTIPNFDTAGSGKALLHVANRLDSSRFEVHIACMHTRGEFFSIVEQAGFPIHVLSFTTPMKPYIKGLIECYKISKHFKSINPDIVHSFHYAPDYSEPLAVRMAGIKWIYTKKNMNWGGSSKNAWHLRSFLANTIVVQNTDMLKDFFKNSNKTVIIPRGVDVDTYKPLVKNEALMKQWHINTNHRLVMCVANLVPVKGIETLLEAFKRVSELYDDWKLMIVGDTNNPYGKAMKILVNTLDMNERVIFCGKQNNIQQYLNLAEIVVLPTLNQGRKEGSPLALLEAMASAKNVLGSNISGIKDQLEFFPKHLVEAGNVKAWSLALIEHCSNSIEQNTRIGNEFREHVINNYHIDREVNLCMQLYQQLSVK